MDPNTALAGLQFHIDNEDWEEVLDVAYDLSDWIRAGGFEPDWSAYPEATDFFRKECAE